jgi:hypothetical protein
LGEGKALVKEEAYGNESCAWIVPSHVEEVRAGGVKDQGGDNFVCGGEMGCERSSYSGAVGDDSLRGDRARGGEVLPGGVGVMDHALLTGAGGGALAVAAVVEGEDVKAYVVEGCESGEGVGEGAVSAG